MSKYNGRYTVGDRVVYFDEYPGTVRAHVDNYTYKIAFDDTDEYNDDLYYEVELDDISG